MEVNPIEQVNHNKGTAKSSEIIILIIILFVFLLIGLAQASRLTHLGAFQDQVMFIDPAANLYFGNGFTSSAWFAQTNGKFWAGYPPFYSFLLYLWMRLVGFGVHTGHSLNCLLIAISVVLLWKSVIRFNLINSAKIRLIFTSLLLLQLGYINNFQQGRPDVLMACLVSTVLFIHSIQQRSLRHIFLVFVAIFFPLTGLAVVAYIVILYSLLLIYLRMSLLKDSILIFTGLTIGFLGLYILYYSNGVWLDFITSITSNPTLSSFSERGKVAGIFGNRILQILVILCFSLSIFEVTKRQFDRFSPLSFGLVSIFWIPLGMRLMGAFPFYYSWMVVIPLAICVFSCLDKLFRVYFDRWLKFPFLGVILILILIISPYSGFTDLILNWRFSSYSYIEAFTQETLSMVKKDSEWIFSDAISYFAAKKEGRVVLYEYYLGIIPSPEKEKVSVLIVRPKNFSVLQGRLGGKWRKHGESLFFSYREEVAALGIYRREQ